MSDGVGWRVVVPVKGGSGAKTRLALPRGARGELATAMALDCLAACLATPGVAGVRCVSDDPRVLAAARALGAATTSPGRPGLAVALGAGLAATGPGPAALLLGDLPALRPDDLAVALAEAAAAPGPLLVPDAGGTGSVLLAERTGVLPHRFGPGSARAHLAAGARTCAAPVPSLRRDVDTVDDLDAAVALGVGERTRRALAASAPRLLTCP